MNLAGTLSLQTDTTGAINTSSADFDVAVLASVGAMNDAVTQTLFVIESFY